MNMQIPGCLAVRWPNPGATCYSNCLLVRRPLMTTEANARMQRPLDAVDNQIAEILREEAVRQATGLELIPSENLVSEAVLEAMGSIFTNKYAEGYPGQTLLRWV